MLVKVLLLIEIKWKNVFSHLIPVNIELIDKVILMMYSCVCATVEQTKIMANIVNIDISVFVFVFVFFFFSGLLN